MVLWSLSNEILWPHSVESSPCFRLSEQVKRNCFVDGPLIAFSIYSLIYLLHISALRPSSRRNIYVGTYVNVNVNNK
jgi:hypothetical protein